MKIGDVVYSTEIRPRVHATVISADVDIRWREKKNGTKKKEIRTKYIAQYLDKTTMTFYGFDIDRTVFKVNLPEGQLHLSDLFDM